MSWLKKLKINCFPQEFADVVKQEHLFGLVWQITSRFFEALTRRAWFATNLPVLCRSWCVCPSPGGAGLAGCLSQVCRAAVQVPCPEIRVPLSWELCNFLFSFQKNKPTPNQINHTHKKANSHFYMQWNSV